jgi:hypothetical protein
MHAAPYVVWAGFDRGDYEIITGQPVSYRSSPRGVREFCPLCGTTLNYGKDARGAPELEEAAKLIYVAVASLDDPEIYPPDEIVHGQEKIAWMHFAGDIPVREFVSPDAGRLQFGGIEQARATELAKDNFGSNESDGT